MKFTKFYDFFIFIYLIYISFGICFCSLLPLLLMLCFYPKVKVWKEISLNLFTHFFWWCAFLNWICIQLECHEYFFIHLFFPLAFLVYVVEAAALEYLKYNEMPVMCCLVSEIYVHNILFLLLKLWNHKLTHSNLVFKYIFHKLPFLYNAAEQNNFTLTFPLFM